MTRKARTTKIAPKATPPAAMAGEADLELAAAAVTIEAEMATKKAAQPEVGAVEAIQADQAGVDATTTRKGKAAAKKAAAAKAAPAKTEDKPAEDKPAEAAPVKRGRPRKTNAEKLAGAVSRAWLDPAPLLSDAGTVALRLVYPGVYVSKDGKWLFESGEAKSWDVKQITAVDSDTADVTTIAVGTYPSAPKALKAVMELAETAAAA